MANREYVKTPFPNDFKGVSQAGLNYLNMLANKLNELLTMKNDLPTYADNAAAVSGGLSAGDWYYDSTLGGVRIVT